jgi:hypothetical protein
MLVLCLALALDPQATAAPPTNEIGDLQLSVTPPALEGLSARLSSRDGPRRHARPPGVERPSRARAGVPDRASRRSVS